VLDTSIPNEVWNAAVREEHPELDGMLCTLCIDELVSEAGLTCDAEFYFVGKAVVSRMYDDDRGTIEMLDRERTELQAANEHMKRQLRSWKQERHKLKAYARAACWLGVERQKVREMVERLVSWVEQFAGEDLPVTLEARTWLDKDWGQTLPKEARVVSGRTK
jgi:hypothetical protein